MIRAPGRPVSLNRRTIPIGVVAALLTVAMLAFLMPSAAAAPAPPYFGPNVQIDVPPAYRASFFFPVPPPSIAAGTDGAVYLAFGGWSGSATADDIYFTKSLNDGRSWFTPVRVNDDSGPVSQIQPSLTLDPANNIYVVWTDMRGGTNDVYFSKSANGGLSFSANVRVNDAVTNSQSEPHIAVDPVNPHLVHVVWTDSRSATTGPDIYYANSTDGGLSFNPSVRVNDDVASAEQGQPAIAVAPNREIYVVWRDPRSTTKGPDIYFSKSTDLGWTWAPNSYVYNDPGNVVQQDPTIAVDAAGRIYVAWTDSRNTNTGPDIYEAWSANTGFTFSASVRVNDDAGNALQMNPSLAATAGKVQLAWADYRTGGSTNWDIYTASSTDGVIWSRNMKVNDDTFSTYQVAPSIAVDAAGDVFAAFSDTRTTGWDVYAATLDVVAPTPNAGPAVTVDQGANVAFDGGGSSDNFGIAGYAWGFGDGLSAPGASANHSYETPGVFTATLTVWDYSGNVAEGTVTVTVRDTQAPVPHGGGDRTVDEGQSLFFDASASTDNVGVTSYRWDFGDNSSTANAAASHVYARPGTYTARLTVMDAAGNSGTSTFSVVVRAVSPKASDLLGMIQILEAIIALLAAALAFVGWLLFGMRKREQRPSAPNSARPQSPPREPMPPLPQAQPSREPDPLDMTFPPNPPNGP